jgi:hypothetical protein
MTTRRLIALAASLPLAAALVVATTSPPSSARAVDERCAQSTPIPASALAAASRTGCSLVGRLVTDGRVSVVVPPPGTGVAGEGVGRHGDVRGLQVVNTGTAVRVVPEGRRSGGAGAATSRRADPPACKDRTFNLEHHTWARSLRYHVNLRKMPKRFRKKTVVHQIKVANGNMRKGRNSCGKPRITAPASHYLGRTAKKPNVTAAGPTCGKGNSVNIVAFAHLPNDLLGWTCYWYNVGDGNHMVGADMLLDNGPSLATKLPATCTSSWDFEGTVTHEWGHAYGMAHTGDGHSNLTMQHLLKPCSKYARTLGLGDWLGMKRMYGDK